jgi:type II secretory pathway pseudopilin PulG
MTMGRLSPAGRRVIDARRRLRARTRCRGDDGFILLESIVAISLITVIMAALATFTINAVNITGEQRARQAAAQLATTTTSTLRSIPATDIVAGRGVTAVRDQIAEGRKNAALAPYLTSMTSDLHDEDPRVAPTAGAAAAVSTSPSAPVVLNNTRYTISTYLGECTVSTGSPDCLAAGSGITYVRAVVAVTWPDTDCPTTITGSSVATCTYVTSTLLNRDDDPIFNIGQTVATAPVVDSPGNQTSTVGAAVSRQFDVRSGTGIPPYTWSVTAGALPAGLTLSASGLVSGSPTTVAAASSATLTVADAFGRTGSTTFTWRVVAAPTVTTPAAQTSQQSQAVSLTVGFTCPNTPCRFTLANAPAGLSINADTGVISGTPTTVGTSANVRITITDADAVATTSAAFTWTIVPSPTIGSPGNRGVTEGQTESVPFTYTCPTTPCTVTLTGTVPGLGLSTSASNATNNTTSSLSVSTATGTLYIAGTVQTSAVTTGTSRGYTPTLTITRGASSDTASGSWTAYVRPTIGAVGSRNATVGSTKNIAVAYTCPYTPCTLSLTNPVPGLGLSTTSGVTTPNNNTSLILSGTSGTVYINGKVTSGAVPTNQTNQAYAVTLTITDSDSASAASTGTWTASREPKITNPGSQAAEPGRTLSLQMDALCPNGGCSWAAAAQPSGDSNWYPVPISPGGVITYSNAPTGTYALRVVVTDDDGISDEVTFPLYVQTFSLSIPDLSNERPDSGTSTFTYDVAARMSPQADGYTYELSGEPYWLTISDDGLLTATLDRYSNTDNSITVTVRSSASSNSVVSDTFRWRVTS